MSNHLYFLGNLRIFIRFLQGILAISALIFAQKVVDLSDRVSLNLF